MKDDLKIGVETGPSIMVKKKFTVIPKWLIQKILLHTKNSNVIQQLVEKTYLDFYKGDISSPGSYFLAFPDKPKSRIIALPAASYQHPRQAGIKWIASNPDNPKQGLARASAVIILNDYETGYPFACLEGSLISAIRTAYSASVALHHIHKLIKKSESKQISSLGIVGTSIIGHSVLTAIQNQGWEIKQVNLFDIEVRNAFRFKDNLSQYNNICVSNHIEELIKESEIIIFTTSSTTPHLHEINLFNHKPIILHISLRDLSPEIILACNNIVDSIDHILSANTSVHLAAQKNQSHSFINGDINTLINGVLKLDQNKATVFSPMGLGVLDLALASYVYTEAIKIEGYIEINNFFDECLS